MNQITVRRIKFSTVGIAVHNYTDNKVTIIGSGFFYDTRGYLMTAGHVLRSAEKLKKYEISKKKNSKIIATSLNVLDGDKIAVEEDEIDVMLLPDIKTVIEHPTTPVIFDVGIAKVVPSRNKYAFLKIKKIPDTTEPHIEVGEEVVICGYPAGEQSLSLKIGVHTGYRFSPVMQFGHIASLMPFDETIPYGIQTDIVSTGGSSGSPIVLKETGEVVGLAQKIIVTYSAVDVPAKAQKKTRLPNILEGFAHIGIVYGDSFHRIADIVNLTKKDFSEGAFKSSHTSYSKTFVRPDFRQDGITFNPEDL